MRLAVIVEVPFVVCRIASNERQLYFLPWFSDGATFACQWTSSRAREAGLHSFSAFLWNMICSFSWSKIRNVFCAGKNWNYICQNGTRFNGIFEVSEIQETWICSEFQLGSIFLPLFELFIYLLNLMNNWTRSHFGSSLALGIGICPPALTCLLVV